MVIDIRKLFRWKLDMTLPDPITPLTPISSLAKNTPMMTVASSGAEDPAAIKLQKYHTEELHELTNA